MANPTHHRLDRVGQWLLKRCDLTEPRMPAALWTEASSHKPHSDRPRSQSEISAALRHLAADRYVVARMSGDARQRWRQTRVLTVDDDPVGLATYVRMVTQLGYRPLAALGRRAGLQLALASDVDVVIADVMMPGPFDGPEMVSEIRRARPGVRAFHITADYDVGPLCDPVLFKPFTLDVLNRAIRLSLSRPIVESKPQRQ